MVQVFILDGIGILHHTAADGVVKFVEKQMDGVGLAEHFKGVSADMEYALWIHRRVDRRPPARLWVATALLPDPLCHISDTSTKWTMCQVCNDTL